MKSSGENININRHCESVHSFREAFAIGRAEVISLVGGGGKTTLMFALAKELASSGKLVVTTTTTRIFQPTPAETQALYLNTNEAAIINWLASDTDNYTHVTVASENPASGKLRGISPELVARIARLQRVRAVIVEADGAARKPLKAPNATEPVFPANTSLVIPVVGIDALGRPLTGDYIFRPEIVAALTGLEIGDKINAASIATLLVHERGIAKGSPAQARIIPFINKVNSDAKFKEAIKIADLVLARGYPRINRIVLGQAAISDKPLTIVSRFQVG